MKYIFLKLLKAYKRILSPVFHYFNPNCGCRFYPTCSEYSHKAIEKFGIGKGFLKSIKRISRCHPFNKGGYDPV